MIIVRYWGETEPRWEAGERPLDIPACGALGHHDAGDAGGRRPRTGVNIDGWQALLPAAAIFMVVRAVLRPLLILLTCPLEILTLGLFIFVINALVFAFTAWISGKLGIGFHVDGFGRRCWGRWWCPASTSSPRHRPATAHEGAAASGLTGQRF